MEFYPEFIIGGAAKSGTTSVCKYLSAHPDLWLPEHELNFFSFFEKDPKYTLVQSPYTTSIEEYERNFKSSNGLIKGEKSISYLYSGLYSQTISNILKYHPLSDKVKIIFILRNPIERAWSQYVYNVDRHEKLPFLKAINAWPERKKIGYVPAFDYLGAGLYHEALNTYLNNFSKVRVYLFEDLKFHKEWLLRDIFNFLEVENIMTHKVNKRYNRSMLPISKNREFIYSAIASNFLTNYAKKFVSVDNQLFIKNLVTSFTHKKPSMPEEYRRQLLPFFKDDINKLQDLIKRNLGEWLK
jgi:hypothetical protein